MYFLKTPTVIRIGNAVAMDLTEAEIVESEVPDPHMTLLFSRNGVPDSTFDAVVKHVEEFAGKRSAIVFTCGERWGQCSNYVKGALKELAESVNEAFPEYANDRPPHVALRKRGGAAKRGSDGEAHQRPAKRPKLVMKLMFEVYDTAKATGREVSEIVEWFNESLEEVRSLSAGDATLGMKPTGDMYFAETTQSNGL